MKLTLREIAIFSMLGAIMFASKILMEFIPNVHLLGVFTMAITVVYRWKALYPIYIYVLINGIYAGFSVWWIPYLYLWTLLWGATMLLPRRLPKAVLAPIYMVVCGLHGLLFGTLYSPAQALFFHLNFEQTVAWIIAGLPWDLIHGVSNFALGSLILPLAAVISKTDRAVRGK